MSLTYGAAKAMNLEGSMVVVYPHDCPNEMYIKLADLPSLYAVFRGLWQSPAAFVSIRPMLLGPNLVMYTAASPTLSKLRKHRSIHRKQLMNRRLCQLTNGLYNGVEGDAIIATVDGTDIAPTITQDLVGIATADRSRSTDDSAAEVIRLLQGSGSQLVVEVADAMARQLAKQVR